MAPPWSTAAEYAYIDGRLYDDGAVYAAAAFVDERLALGGEALELSAPFPVVVHMYRVVRRYDAFADVIAYELS